MSALYFFGFNHVVKLVELPFKLSRHCCNLCYTCIEVGNQCYNLLNVVCEFSHLFMYAKITHFFQ